MELLLFALVVTMVGWLVSYWFRCRVFMLPHTHRVRRGNYLYAFRGSGESYFYIKIGRATDPVSRLRGFQTANPHGIEVLAVWPVRNAVEAEAAVHSLFKGSRYRGEWFRWSPKLWLFLLATRSGHHTRRVRARIKPQKRAFV